MNPDHPPKPPQDSGPQLGLSHHAKYRNPKEDSWGGLGGWASRKKFHFTHFEERRGQTQQKLFERDLDQFLIQRFFSGGGWTTPSNRDRGRLSPACVRSWHGLALSSVSSRIWHGMAHHEAVLFALMCRTSQALQPTPRRQRLFVFLDDKDFDNDDDEHIGTLDGGWVL